MDVCESRPLRSSVLKDWLRDHRSLLASVVAWVIAGAGFVIALTIPAVRLPSDDLGLRRFHTPEIDAATTFSQTFIMTADGLHAIEFAGTPAGGPVSGSVRLELQQGRSGIVRSAEVKAADVVSAPMYRFEFQPIPDSKDSVYRLDVRSSEQSPSKGVAVWATKGERYPGGTMLINDRERWADLTFETFAPAGRSSWRRLMDMPGAESGLSQARVVIAGLAAYWAALGVVLRALSGMQSRQ